MTGIPLVNADDMVSSKKKGEENAGVYKRESFGSGGRIFKKKEKKEKPIRVIRVKCYEKMYVPSTEGNKEIFVVDRDLEELLKALYYITNIEGMIPPPGKIFVEKDSRMNSNFKFIFIEISREEFPILKRQLENHVTICALNKGEFSILEGGKSYLRETFDMPGIWRGREDGGDRGYREDREYRRDGNKISDNNTIIVRQKLREELKEKLRAYHSYSDDDIDNMGDIELKNLKKLTNEKMKLENRRRKATQKFLK